MKKDKKKVQENHLHLAMVTADHNRHIPTISVFVESPQTDEKPKIVQKLDLPIK